MFSEFQFKYRDCLEFSEIELHAFYKIAVGFYENEHVY